MKNLIMLGLGYALNDEKGRKTIFRICKNGGNMMLKELEKSINVDIKGAFNELLKDEEVEKCTK